MWAASVCFLFVSLFPLCPGQLVKTAENYGPFTVKWNDYSACRGPKAVNLSEYVTHLIVDNATNIYKGILNFTFSNSAKMDEVKMVVYSLKGERRSLLWSYRVDKPCQHYAIADILEKQFGVHNCLFLKGHHDWTINFTECVHKYLGDSFFYGEFVFKLYVLSKKGNIACLVFTPMFSKKS
ncbi:uncharacterized protein LOC119629902 [Bombyx mori]|uniref:Uncharacterized protein n=1 Tax=Bombyx mori TaxID=7091 RepID=A0A8R2R2H8_BOMMO|nr:uncharacterized protein LOC119629902 [Bombyx mori]